MTLEEKNRVARAVIAAFPKDGKRSGTNRATRAAMLFYIIDRPKAHTGEVLRSVGYRNDKPGNLSTGLRMLRSLEALGWLEQGTWRAMMESPDGDIMPTGKMFTWSPTETLMSIVDGSSPAKVR